MNIPIDDLGSYIGEKISRISKELILEERASSFSTNGKTYSNNFDKSKIVFFEQKCKRLSIETDNNDTITKIYFSLENILTEKTFSLIVKKYGNPSMMMKMGKIIKKESSINDDYISSSITSDLVDCSFSDKPIVINWFSKRFKLQINMDCEGDSSFISIESNHN